MMGNEALDRTQEADQAPAWQSPERETPPDRYRIKPERAGEGLTSVGAPTGSVRVMPLLRLQGMVEAQGLELQDLCALPPDLLAETQAAIDELRAHELALKRRGRWQSSDLLRHAADRLRAIDELIYPPQHFEDVADVEE